jgi:hypothetical protein
LPDNLAWVSVAIILIQASKMPLTRGQYLFAGLVLLGAMLVKQTNLWLAGVIWATGLANILYYQQRTISEKAVTAQLAMVVTLPAFILFYLIYQLWGGLVPPSFQKIHQHISWSVPAFFFAVFAVYSAFYLPILFSQLRQKCRFNWIGFGLLLGFVVAIVVDTNYDPAAGRLSGLWNFVKFTPVIDNKSVLLIALSSFGGGLYCAMLQLLEKSLRLVIVLATLAFVIFLIPNLFVYERYFSSFIFILLMIFVSRIDKQNLMTLSCWVWTGPVLFTLLNIALLFRGVA